MTRKSDSASSDRAASSKDLKSFRVQIDKLDQQILKLINHRATVTSKYYQSQESPRKAMFAPQLEEDLRQLVETSNPGPLPAPAAATSTHRDPRADSPSCAARRTPD